MSPPEEILKAALLSPADDVVMLIFFFGCLAGVPPDFVSWTGTLMGRPTTTAAANHRFPPGLAWLVGSAMAAAVFTEVGLRGRCGSNRTEQRGAVSLSSSGGNNDDDDTAALLSSSWRTSHTRVLTLRYIGS